MKDLADGVEAVQMMVYSHYDWVVPLINPDAVCCVLMEGVKLLARNPYILGWIRASVGRFSNEVLDIP